MTQNLIQIGKLTGISTIIKYTSNYVLHTCSGWVQEVTTDARNGFVRAAELGGKLHEQWLISNAVVYLWNYSQHILVTPARHVELVDSFRSILNTIKTITLQGCVYYICYHNDDGGYYCIVVRLSWCVSCAQHWPVD